ncbi:DUF1919 domain-containing protein [Stieleria sp. JC731]|uniref:DUF1919 domain-containing protein n=1 Tax=Pirellulaceae TaxID=2691357 RepID=UPI001E55F4B8|nr:DUF1919 domain-containing protein [Stieleria sp. JC731]MCC9603301.1 DUF1919 domain-containing protein [Stieleria sp. JC731]
MQTLAKSLLKRREALAHYYSRKLLPDSFSIISDDCWGGQIYRQLKLPYTTPTVGLFVEPSGYLDFVEAILAKRTETLTFIDSDEAYPVATFAGIPLHFMHYHSEDEARDKFSRRISRIDWNHLLVKIDFGKDGYTESDTERWNQLRLEHAVALYSPTVRVPSSGIYNGVLIEDWIIDGASMFNQSRRYFDVFQWIRTGQVRNQISYRLANSLLLDPSSPGRLRRRIKNS